MRHTALIQQVLKAMSRNEPYLQLGYVRRFLHWLRFLQWHLSPGYRQKALIQCFRHPAQPVPYSACGGCQSYRRIRHRITGIQFLQAPQLSVHPGINHESCQDLFSAWKCPVLYWILYTNRQSSLHSCEAALPLKLLR